MLNVANMMQIQTRMYKLWSEGSVNTAVPKKFHFLTIVSWFRIYRVEVIHNGVQLVNCLKLIITVKFRYNSDP